MAESSDIICCVADTTGLSPIVVAGLQAWSIAAGEWASLGLEEASAKALLLSLIRACPGDPLQFVKQMRIRSQQILMSLRAGSFEAIQREPPFRRHALNNMHRLLRGWQEEGESGFTRAWQEAFHSNRQHEAEPESAIAIVGEGGYDEDHALVVSGAPDRQTSVAAEWWYLYFTFGQAWEPGMHATTRGKTPGTRFSVHEIILDSGIQKSIYFRAG